MGFVNSVVGGLTLVRAAIRSPNYVAGSAGWSINKDGSAEFSNILVRGIFEAGGTGSSPHITMLAAPNLPAPLATYLYLGSLSIKSAIIFYATNGSPNDYFFIAFVDNIGAEIALFGYVRAGSVQELSAGIPLGLNLQAASQFPLPAGSVALSQATNMFGRFNFLTAQGPAYVIGETVEYTANGTFDADNYVGIRAALMRGMAGGGGGGFGGAAVAGNASAGGGGGGGGYAEALITSSTLGSLTWTVTVGTAGAGGTSAVIDGTAGGTMSVVNGGTTLLSATGGGGGESVAGSAGVAVAQGGTGGVGTVGDFLAQGDYGQNGVHGTNFAVAGQGGAGALWGLSTRGNAADAGGAGVAPPANSGSGGSGGADQPGSNTARNGGAGSTGRVRITVLY